MPCCGILLLFGVLGILFGFHPRGRYFYRNYYGRAHGFFHERYNRFRRF